VITEVLRPRPGSSALVTDLLLILEVVAGLISDGVFHGASRVLTLLASHKPPLDFGAVRRGCTARWSADQLCELGQSLEPVAAAIAKMTAGSG
jgi:hypothetical protein